MRTVGTGVWRQASHLPTLYENAPQLANVLPCPLGVLALDQAGDAALGLAFYRRPFVDRPEVLRGVGLCVAAGRVDLACSRNCRRSSRDKQT
jgi:hypothetical protein